jgi:ring-1,2-phenylacetyl-CoA epoxidase subunit PaaA
VRTAIRSYAEGDPDLPAEFRELLVRMLTHHIENTTNPHYIDLLEMLWNRCLTLPSDDDAKVPLARLMMQEVEHGVITANILKGLGAGPVKTPIQQYAFHLPIESFCDLAYFHALIDRVGVYVGETWEGVPYEPLLKVAPKLQRDEVFHSTLGMHNLQSVCSTPEGLAQANELIEKWWPAALDMFGRSDSEFSDAYVRWGIRRLNNAQLRHQYVADTRPMLESLGIIVPANRLNRRFL